MAALAAAPAVAQNCGYTTIAGLAVTFRGEGEPAKDALFHWPSAVAVAKDGTIYVADTGNNRVRAIDPAGIVRTVAGTGEPAYRGDGEDARSAALQSPSGVAVAEDGAIYIADTGNHRIRRVTPEGEITTIAGEGHARFGGDGGEAIAASLNKPTTLAFDAAGNLYVLDSGNYRIRRIDPAGRIATVAGANTLNDYQTNSGETSAPVAATEAVNLLPTAFAAAPDGTLYVVDRAGVRRIGADGILRDWITFVFAGAEVTLGSPAAVESLRLSTVTAIAVGGDGTIALSTARQSVAISEGTAHPLGKSLGAGGLSFDPSTGDIIAAGRTVGILRRTASGERIVLASAPVTGDWVAALEGELDSPGGVAVGPDGTVYISEMGANRILAVDRSGQIRRFAGADADQGSPANDIPALTAQLYGPRWLAVDSKGVVYFVEPGVRRIRKVGTDGIISVVRTTSEVPLSLGIDGEDRMYVFLGQTTYPRVVRYNTDGSSTEMIRDHSGSFYWPGAQYPESAPGMTVTKDGTVYIGQTGRFSNTKSSVMRIKPDQTWDFVPMDEHLFPRALAAGADGGLYLAYGRILKKALPDGTIATVRNGDGLGFWGEHGYDSAPISDKTILDLAIDADGAVLALDCSGLRRIDPACQVTAGPSISSVSDTASSSTSLKLAPGQLFSIYGLRPGPDGGRKAEADETGHYPVELAGVQVTVNGRPAPLLSAGPARIDAVVPFDLDEQTTASIVVTRDGVRSDTFQKLLGRWGPAILPTETAKDYARMLNEDGTANGPESPAKLGSKVSIFASGLGATEPAGEDGRVADSTPKLPVHTAKFTMDGEPAEVLYQGTSAGMVEGVARIDLRLPTKSYGSPTCSLTIGRDEWVPQSSVRFYCAK